MTRNRRQGSTRRLYYWILARDPDTGKLNLIRGGWSEEEARQKGLEMLAGIEFEVRGLRTTNIATASSIIRGERLERTHSLKKASERIGHEKTVRRMRRRRGL